MPTTITLPSKFTQDENGNKFAPITTPNAVRFPDGTNLNDHLGGGSFIPVVLLYEPSTPKSGMIIFDVSDTNKFYQYQLPIQGSARWVEVSTPHKAIGVGNNDYMYEIIDGVLSQTPIADFEYNTWYIYYTGGPRYQIGQVVFIDEYQLGGMLPTYMDVYNWNNKQDAITFNSLYDATINPAATMADVSGKEDKMSIVQITETISTLSPAINTLYVIGASTLDVTLPTITDTTKVQSFVLMLSFVSSTASVTIHGTQDNICSVYMPTDISLEAGKTYEINCMFYGQATRTTTFNLWSVAIHDIGEVNPL